MPLLQVRRSFWRNCSLCVPPAEIYVFLCLFRLKCKKSKTADGLKFVGKNNVLCYLVIDRNPTAPYLVILNSSCTFPENSQKSPIRLIFAASWWRFPYLHPNPHVGDKLA